MTTAKFVRHIYKADGREMVALNPQESMSLNIALMQGKILYEEVAELKRAMKEEKSNAS
jgi:hypothetical protein